MVNVFVIIPLFAYMSVIFTTIGLYMVTNRDLLFDQQQKVTFLMVVHEYHKSIFICVKTSKNPRNRHQPYGPDYSYDSKILIHR